MPATSCHPPSLPQLRLAPPRPCPRPRPRPRPRPPPCPRDGLPRCAGRGPPAAASQRAAVRVDEVWQEDRPEGETPYRCRCSPLTS
eukprot:3188809-Pyramimonas_sp.AAC.1